MNPRRTIASLSRLLMLAGLFAALTTGRAMAVEEPANKTVLQDGDFSVRDYPALPVAQVTVTGTQRGAASDGFRLLANYIFGGNVQRQRFAMTAPVVQAHTHHAPPTTPAPPATPATPATPAEWTVRFFLPAGSNPATLPAPNDSQVRLLMLPPQRVAVLRFSGWASADSFATHATSLAERAAAHHLHITGPISLAQYNPPWTLWFMRRNEVMAPVAP